MKSLDDKQSNQVPTPRTDTLMAIEPRNTPLAHDWAIQFDKLMDHARQLERELAESDAKVRDWVERHESMARNALMYQEKFYAAAALLPSIEAPNVIEARLNWVRLAAQKGLPCPSRDEMAAFHDGFVAARSASAEIIGYQVTIGMRESFFSPQWDMENWRAQRESVSVKAVYASDGRTTG